MTIKINSSTKIEEIEKLLKDLSKRSKFNASKYLGKIKLKEDPVKIQERLRNEWD